MHLERIEILVRSVVVAYNKKMTGEELDAVILRQEVIKDKEIWKE